MATIKQRKAAKEVVGNGGNITKAMLAAGYSVATANTPQKLTESEGWKELMNKYLPDELLAKKHQALLNKKEMKTVFAPDLGQFITEPTGEIDAQAVKAGLDMGYKLKGKYAAEKHLGVNLNVEAKISSLPPEAIQIIEENLKKKKIDEL